MWFNEESIHIYSSTTDLILPAVLSTDCRILEDSWETDVSNKLSSTACKRTTIRTVSINNLPNKQHPVNKTRRLLHLNHIISSFHITTNTPEYTEQDVLIWSHKHTLTNKQHTWSLRNHSLTHIHKTWKMEEVIHTGLTSSRFQVRLRRAAWGSRLSGARGRSSTGLPLISEALVWTTGGIFLKFRLSSKTLSTSCRNEQDTHWEEASCTLLNTLKVSNSLVKGRQMYLLSGVDGGAWCGRGRAGRGAGRSAGGTDRVDLASHVMDLSCQDSQVLGEVLTDPAHTGE